MRISVKISQPITAQHQQLTFKSGEKRKTAVL